MRNTVSQSELMATERSLTRDNKADSDMIDEHFEVALVTIVGGPTHGGAKMTGGRSPPQLCFSLSWLDSSSTAAALTFRPLYIGALRAAAVDPSNEAQAAAWVR